MTKPPDKGPPAATVTSLPGEATPTEALPERDDRAPTFTPGQILGERYRIESLLGRGGMGEVWKAYDLKLRVEVALKTLTGELFTDARAFELVRREVRAAREVVSPNVCRIFDLVEVDGHELVSMEYIDGSTLLELLRERGPLELRRAGEIAAQLLAGLEAIHGAGLVHRDVKPENVMLTRAGRVVLMDFGLAARKAEAAIGLRAGTPDYMSPEQQRGEGVDARTDVYAAGLVLAEMICAEGLSDDSTRQTLWKALRHDPPAIPESPWRPILLRAVAKDREARFESAAALARALEEVAFRIEGAEDRTPYPGLSSFKEQDAEFFFGREAEVESVWKKLEHATLLGTIGASGSGKSSFVRAGLIPAKPEGWGHVICQPGSAPFAALGQVLLPEVGRDDEAMRELIGLEDPELALSAIGRWRWRYDEVLLIVDQFEELFTQNTPEVQSRFASLLGRVALEADVHVLLAMRDDFLIPCTQHEALAPVLSELTALHPPTGSALRRALIQPALACGYRFADEAMVEEMLAEVTRERGALPLIAFTAAQLWEHRDRETGHLTREAYDEMGGVGGALAQHAEATLEQIGRERQPIVRELFRNLVTAQGTRAARDMEELLSIFVVSEALEYGTPTLESRSVAVEVLQALIDARLLTSFEVPNEEGEGARKRVEIIHESLLTAWPRLVRWQTQDAEGAQLRDELRQAAAAWDKHGRRVDLLWTGASYREFQLWRERYPGGLTATEEAFARATVAYAGRIRRRRRFTVASVMALLVVVVAVVGGLWRQARLEGRRSEAARLVALGRLDLAENPTFALAHAIASLEQADHEDARRLAVEALWRGPAAIKVDPLHASPNGVAFSPDGRWLATGDYDGTVRVWHAKGGAPVVFDGHDAIVRRLAFGEDSDFLATLMSDDPFLTAWSIPDGRVLGRFDNPLPDSEGTLGQLIEAGGQLLTHHFAADRIVTEAWRIGDRQSDRLGRWESTHLPDRPLAAFDVDPSRARVVYTKDRALFVRALDGPGGGEPVLVGRHELPITALAFDPDGDRLATADKGGEIRIWPVGSDSRIGSSTVVGRHPFHVMIVRFDPGGEKLIASGWVDDGDGRRGEIGVWPLSRASTEPERILDTLAPWFDLDETGSKLVACPKAALPHFFLYDLDGPLDAEPIELGWTNLGWVDLWFHPSGRWLATTNYDGTAIWPLARRYPYVIAGDDVPAGVAFTPDGRRLVSTSNMSGKMWLWPLTSGAGEARELDVGGRHAGGVVVDPLGRFAVSASRFGSPVRVVPLDGGEVRELRSFFHVFDVAVDPGGRLVAFGAGNLADDEEIGQVIVWDLESGEERILNAGDGQKITDLEFTAAGDLLVASGDLRLWDLGTGEHRVVLERTVEKWQAFQPALPESEVCARSIEASRDGRYAVSACRGRARFHDLETGASRSLTSHGTHVVGLALDPSGTTVVTGDLLGVVRVGPTTGEEPHLLLGHAANEWVGQIDVSADGRWIATASGDGTIRIWPMPEGRPLHTLPYEELLAKLRALTNFRPVRDDEELDGYRMDFDPFPGWETVPTW